MTALPLEPSPPPAASGELDTVPDFLAAITAAVSVDVLRLIAGRVSKAGLAGEDLVTVRAAWGARNAELAQKASAA